MIRTDKIYQSIQFPYVFIANIKVNRHIITYTLVNTKTGVVKPINDSTYYFEHNHQKVDDEQTIQLVKMLML